MRYCVLSVDDLIMHLSYLAYNSINPRPRLISVDSPLPIQSAEEEEEEKEGENNDAAYRQKRMGEMKYLQTWKYFGENKRDLKSTFLLR